MRTSAKLGLTALIAALLLASALSTASARNLSTNTQNIRTTWSRLEFVGTLTVRCPVTLEGSFHSRTIPKVARLLIGAVTRIDIRSASCTGGTATVARLPWHITYEGFTGTLPSISSVRLLLQRFLFALMVTVLGVPRTCQYGTASDNISGEVSLNNELLVRNLIPIEGSNTANLLEGPRTFPECPLTGRMRATTEDGVTRILNTTEGFIKITLI
jgi:hypothetical protein